MESGDFFKVIDSKCVFKEGTVLLLGDTETMEFFNITTEISTGESWTSCEVDVKHLLKFDDKKQLELKKIFNDFINQDYKINVEILNY